MTGRKPSGVHLPRPAGGRAPSAPPPTPAAALGALKLQPESGRLGQRVARLPADRVSRPPQARALESMSPWSWLPPALWTCPRCATTILTREAAPRCPRCGHYSDD